MVNGVSICEITTQITDLVRELCANKNGFLVREIKNYGLRFLFWSKISAVCLRIWVQDDSTLHVDSYVLLFDYRARLKFERARFIDWHRPQNWTMLFDGYCKLWCFSGCYGSYLPRILAKTRMWHRHCYLLINGTRGTLISQPFA